jgi:Domain of unknown function (DUF5655)
MSQPSPLPVLLPPEAVQLIDGQYADRPHLRPVLNAVLAAVPALGEVTVEARQTLVSLVTPRRTFAVVQATTKNRVDLGLRLRLAYEQNTARPPPRRKPAPPRNESVRLSRTQPDRSDIN